MPVSEETFNAFSPKFSALYSLLEERETGSLGRVNLNLYVAYSEAFKPPRSPSGLNPPPVKTRIWTRRTSPTMKWV